MKLSDALDVAWQEWSELTVEEKVERIDPDRGRDLLVEFYREMVEARDSSTISILNGAKHAIAEMDVWLVDQGGRWMEERADEIFGGDPDEPERSE